MKRQLAHHSPSWHQEPLMRHPDLQLPSPSTNRPQLVPMEPPTEMMDIVASISHIKVSLVHRQNQPSTSSAGNHCTVSCRSGMQCGMAYTCTGSQDPALFKDTHAQWWYRAHGWNLSAPPPAVVWTRAAEVSNVKIQHHFITSVHP